MEELFKILCNSGFCLKYNRNLSVKIDFKKDLNNQECFKICEMLQHDSYKQNFIELFSNNLEFKDQKIIKIDD